jgi:hypothetical protein
MCHGCDSWQEVAEDATDCPLCGSALSVRPAWLTQGMDLRRAARIQRLLAWLIVVGVVCWIGVPVLSVAGSSSRVILTLTVTIHVLRLVGVVLTLRLMTFLGDPVYYRVAAGAMMLVPCAGDAIMAAMFLRVTTALGQIGLPVAFFGLRDADVVRILGPNHCRQCGYSLVGNTSGRCPECGMVGENRAGRGS